MRSRIIVGITVLTVSTALASLPGLAQSATQAAKHHSAPLMDSTTASPEAELSPGGVSASPNSYNGGPGFTGQLHGTPAKTATYSLKGPQGAELSPGGIGASPNSYNGGPGFAGGVAAGTSNIPAATYSLNGPRGGALSPGGVSASPNGYNSGPGYNP
jgi:hypothetical protein